MIGRIIYENAHWVFHEERNCNKQVIKGIHALRNVIVSHYIGKVILFTGKNLRSEYLRLIVNLCRSMRIGYYLVPDISHLPAKHPWNKLFPYIPLLECFTTERESLAKMTIKRFIDIVIAFFGLLLFLPVGIIIAFAIKHEDGGPIFYLTKRVGKNGNPVHFYKFRTMVVDADTQKEKLLQYNTRKDGPLFKMKNDPRITKVGRFVRKYNLDEVPQLINVLIGNMSLIGPRPHLPQEVAAYTDCDYLRLECIPGIVCLPQVSGRKDTLGFREWVDMDLDYRAKWSLRLDLKIIFKTMKILLQPILKNGSDCY